jgi:cell division septum initiation protein DivIVA
MAKQGKNIRAGRAFVELFTDNKKLEKGLKNAQASLKKFGASVAKIGATLTAASASIIAPLVLATNKYAALGDQLAKDAARIGTTADALAKLNFAAERSGVSTQSLQTALSRMNRTLGDAARGMGTGGRALEAMGLDAKKLAGLSPEDQLALIADRLNQIEDIGERTSIGAEIFGRGFIDLLPLLAEGSAGIKRLQDESERLEGVYSKEEIALAVAYQDQMLDLRKAMQGVGRMITSVTMPAFIKIAKIITEATIKGRHYVSENKALIANIVFGAALVGVLGVALTALGTSFILAAKTIGVVIVAFKAVLVLGKLLVLGFAAIKLAILAVPILLALVGVEFAKMYDSGRRVFTMLTSRFQELYQVAGEIFGAIASAIMKGDITTAMAVLWSGIRLLWLQGKLILMQIWYDIVEYVIVASYIIPVQLSKVWGEITGAFRGMVSIMEIVFTAFVGWFVQMWERSVGGLTGVILKMMKFLGMLSEEELDIALASNARDVEQSIENIRAGVKQKYKDITDEGVNAAAASAKKLAEQERKAIEDIANATAAARAEQVDDINAVTLAYEKELGVLDDLKNKIGDTEGGILDDALSNYRKLVDKISGIDTDIGELDQTRDRVEAKGGFQLTSATMLGFAAGPLNQIERGINKIAKNTSGLPDLENAVFE